MDRHSPDRDLLIALAAGDHHAFDLLADRHQGFVRAACLRQLRASESDDCVQAVFLVLLRKPQQALRAAALAPWLQMVARHVCATARRAAASRLRAEQDAATARLPPSIPDDPDPAIAHLDSCIAQLPTRQRAVITMHYLAGTPRDEVARQLGLDVDTIHQYSRRGLEKLKRLLQQRGITISLAALGTTLVNQSTASAAISSLPVSSAAISAAATSFASGAMTAMTLASVVPASVLTFVLLLAVAGTTVGVIAAETQSPPVPVVPSHPAFAANVLGDSWTAEAQQRLSQQMHIDFTQTSLSDIAHYLSRLSNLPFVIDPAVVAAKRPLVTLQVDHLSMADVLYWVGRLTGTHHEVRDHAILITDKAPLDQAAVVEDATTVRIRQALDQPITFTFADSGFADVVAFLRQVSGMNIVVEFTPDSVTPITLKVKSMPLKDALKWICLLCNLHMTVAHQAIALTPIAAVANPVQAMPSTPPSVGNPAKDF